MPPDEPAFGKTYREWAAAYGWWSRTYLSATEDCAQGQQGEGWFLPSFPATTATVECSVPTGTAILAPVAFITWHFAGGCDATLDLILQGLAGFDAIRVEVDGQAVPDLDRYRVEPTPLPAPGTPTASPAAAGDDPAAGFACGSFLLLAPLPAGEHAVHLTVAASPQGPVDLTWRLRVVPPGQA